MINAVGRNIPDYLLKDGKEVYQGKQYMDGKYIQKAAPRTVRYEKPVETKVVATIVDALKKCGAKSGMTFSFPPSLACLIKSLHLQAKCAKNLISLFGTNAHPPPC